MDSIQHCCNVKTTYDTIFVMKPNVDMDQVYQNIIQNQQSTYNIIITVFLGLIALFAGATWLYQRKINKEDIETKVKETFELEKKTFLENQKLEFQNEIHHLKAESARLFAIINSNWLNSATDENEKIMPLVNLVFWWNEVCQYQILSRNPQGERVAVDNFKYSLERVVQEGLEFKFIMQFQKQYKYELLYDTLKYIDETLKKETDEIYSLLNYIPSIKTSTETVTNKKEPNQEDKHQDDNID